MLILVLGVVFQQETHAWQTFRLARHGLVLAYILPHSTRILVYSASDCGVSAGAACLTKLLPSASRDHIGSHSGLFWQSSCLFYPRWQWFRRGSMAIPAWSFLLQSSVGFPRVPLLQMVRGALRGGALSHTWFVVAVSYS